MRIRITTTFVLAAALSLDAAAANAQGARSTTRIPVSKDAPGEVMPPRVDTVTLTVYRTDTLRVPGPTRVDTVTTTVTRYDTTRVETLPGGLARVGGFYFGLGLGETNAHQSIRSGQTAGFTAQAQIGWQGVTAPLGLRFDANYARFGEEPVTSALAAHPDVLNLSADAKLGLTFLNRMFSYPRFGLYAIGGPTYTRYKALRITQNVNGIEQSRIQRRRRSWFGLGPGGTVRRVAVLRDDARQRQQSRQSDSDHHRSELVLDDGDRARRRTQQATRSEVNARGGGAKHRFPAQLVPPATSAQLNRPVTHFLARHAARTLPDLRTVPRRHASPEETSRVTSATGLFAR